LIDKYFHKFILKPYYFDNLSMIHGFNHTFRVMVNVLTIGNAIGLNNEVKEAFCAAFVHDMSRKNDGYCTEHGLWAAQNKIPLFIDLFREVGIDKTGMENIKLAVTLHSSCEELDLTHPAGKTIALLKDADALDRIRISEIDLKEDLLRFSESCDKIEFAKKLFYASHAIETSHFNDIYQISLQLK